MAEQRGHSNEAIAVVGSACRFAGEVTSPSKLWDLLQRPVDVLSEIPPTRFDAEKYYHPDPLHHGTSNVRHSYLLSGDHRLFDAPFFRVKPVEAAAIDPQQRMLLEITYEALECAGIPMEELQGSNTGVWVGLMGEEYSRTLEKDMLNLPTYFASGTARNNASNRISYFFDLHGPSMTIDTACSSSLVALHQAMSSLRSGEVDVAIVAGANLLLGPEQYIASSKLKMLSPSGRSRMWDENADGYARGDGFGVLVLKTQSDAIIAQDHIECLVRETGVNQDGRTKGITMPSAAAQAKLIQATYERAGLDLGDASDRPQLFEAHGTGTPAGDPIEAEAISSVFFGPQCGFTRAENDSPLYVGSVKTVLGHTEGAAGILGVLKASLALQHSQIPPNMLLEKLSQTVQPFCTHLHVPRGNTSLDWPEVPSNCPRRASVNSFGFGGTNAHAILESFDNTVPRDESSARDPWNGPPLTPFNFSASSNAALRAGLGAYASFLRANQSVNLRDLAWTLNTRRSVLSAKMSVWARTTPELWEKLDDASKQAGDIGRNNVSTTTTANTVSESANKNTRRRLIGIFTGQGAQWAGMGQALVQECPLVASCFDSLQGALDTLPRAHAPNWLLRDPDMSRIGEAVVSQPLCTAVQIALVQLLRAAGIEFAAVVGHSSGEIAAAYAAGHISAEDAIRIAYYRGLFLEDLESGHGAMVAVGTSPEDAEELCALPSLSGRVCVAAKNSPMSVTISGDIDSIRDVEEIMEDEGKFVRRLRVDKAYHSHHMQACAPKYVDAISRCCTGAPSGPKCQTDSRSSLPKPIWISSVTGQRKEPPSLSSEELAYWGENLCKPVLFSQALEHALISTGPFDSIIEIGPHPALQRPVLDTLQAFTGAPLTAHYVGTLNRNEDDVGAFANTLGTLWQNGFPVNFRSFDQTAYSHDILATSAAFRAPKLITNLPTYAWDHDRVHWHESRRARSHRLGSKGDFDLSRTPNRQLLGARCLDTTDNEYQFRNYLSPSAYPWLADHRIQGQIVLPASAYVCTVVEAVHRIWPADELCLVELSHISIKKAVTFLDPVAEVDAGMSSRSGIETCLLLKISDESAERINASFSFCSCADTEKDATVLTENCCGQLVITRKLSAPQNKSDSLLPHPRLPKIESQLLSLEPQTFYGWARDLGYGYEGGFHGLTNIKRKLNESTALIGVDFEDTNNIINPATIDCAIQAVLLAYSCPGDGRMRSMHMPIHIDCLRLDLSSCRATSVERSTTTDKVEPKLPCYATVVPGFDLVGDVEVHDYTGDRPLIQMQGLHAKPLSQNTADNDVDLFFETVFGPEQPERSHIKSISTTSGDSDVFSSERSLCTAAERVACFHLRRLGEGFPQSERPGLPPYLLRLLGYVDDVLERIAAGVHPYAASAWLTDSSKDIDRLITSYDSLIDFKIIPSAGESLLEALKTRGSVSILETLARDELLTDYYLHGLGMPYYLSQMAQTVGQLGHRFPKLNILEIGAGTGAATSSILAQLEGRFCSYTYTDISSSFFQGAESKFSSINQPDMSFRTLDIENPPSDQGYEEASYDLIVASLALHATKDLDVTLANTRRLLKPGGYLVMLELTDADSLRVGLIFGGLPGWWVGSNADGRLLSPCVSCEAWKHILLRTGFSMVDVVVPSDEKSPVPLSVLVCQAVNQDIEVLVDPLSNGTRIPELKSLTIIGTGHVAEDLSTTMRKYYSTVSCVATLEAAVKTEKLHAGASVISLIDSNPSRPPAFENLSAVQLSAVQKLFKTRGAVIWVSWGCRAARPFANMFRGLRRSAVLELVDARVQTLDFDAADEVDARIIAAKLLQLEAYGSLHHAGRMNDVLWYCEPELFVEQGRVMVPRLRKSCRRNQRYNSTRRFVYEDVSIKDAALSVRCDDSSFRVVQEKRDSRSAMHGGAVELRYSLLRSISVSSSSVYLSMGRSRDTGQSVFVLSSSLDSNVFVPSAWTLPAPDCPDQGLKTLKCLEDHLLAREILAKAIGRHKSKSLVVLDPEYSLGQTMSRMAADEGVCLVLLTTTLHGCFAPWSYVHPRETSQGIRRLLPCHPFAFVDMSTTGGSGASTFVWNCIPGSATRMSWNDFLHDDSELDVSPACLRVVSDHLQAAWLQLGSITADASHQPGDSVWQRKVHLDELNRTGSRDLGSNEKGQILLCWEGCDTVRVQVQPANMQIEFAPDKTYWLVGLTRGLGLSTAQWMADHGARFIALSSRKPRVDPDWIEYMRLRGCTVRVFSNDIVKRESVQALYRQLASTMPPIAGVAQGAMVLHDAVFPDLDITRLQKTLEPKVQGSLFLDELFPGDTLDFFIFFSSMAYVVGNRGQSAYTAANAFMASLAAQRRQRGLAASVINIGGIVGEGYVSRQLAEGKQSALAKAGFEFMSEQAFHELFAEGILSSRDRGSEEGFEISSGLRVGDVEGTSFGTNPIFQHLVSKTNVPANAEYINSTSTSNMPVKGRLLQATTEEDIDEIIETGLLLKLQATLHVTLDRQSALSSSPDQLGVDSLVAVDIQSWFLKELCVELPVMKILNSTSMANMIRSARELLPTNVLPRVRTSTDEERENDIKLKPLSSISPTEPTENGRTISTEIEDWDGTESSVDSTISEGARTPSTSMSRTDNVDETTSVVSNSAPTSIIERTASEKHYSKFLPMSFSQSRFWFLNFALADPSVFNVTTIIRLQGSISTVAMQKALVTVGNRHEAIRTAFYSDPVTHQHMQGVLFQSPLYLEYSEVTGEEEVHAAVREMEHRVFDLSSGVSLGLKLLSFPGDQNHVLILGYHHIAVDGIGNQVFLSDLEKAYYAHKLGRDVEDDADMLQYPDFTLRQLQEYQRGSWSKQLDFWRRQFADLPPPLPLLSLSRRIARPDTTTYSCHSVQVHLDPRLKLRIRQICKQHAVTPFHFYLAVFGVLLYRYAHGDKELTDLCIGVADGGRKDADVLRSLGLFLNILPLRFRTRSQVSFSDVLGQTKKTSDDAFGNSRPPIDVIFNELQVPRSPSHSPLFQAFMNYRPHISDTRSFCGCNAEGELVSGGETGYDVTLDVLDSSSRENRIMISVNSALYTLQDAKVLQRSYLNLLQAFAAKPITPVGVPPLHPHEDVMEAIQLGRGPEISHTRWPATVVHRIDDMAIKYADRIALTSGTRRGRSLTYTEMADRSSVVASHVLPKLGKSNRGQGVVGLFQVPGPDWVCSFLGVLRTGATCVPLECQLGLARLLSVAQDCAPDVILVDATTKTETNFLRSTGALVIDVSESESSARTTGESSCLTRLNLAETSGCAVIAYTSGSTGVPKGSGIQHSAYRNFVEFTPPRWAMNEGLETVLQQSSHAFDLSIAEILICLAYGGTLVIPDESRRRDPSAICDTIASEGVTMTIGTPTEYLAWLRYDGNARDGQLCGSKWRKAITAGEPVTLPLVEAFRLFGQHNPSFCLINLYGPSETTIGCADGVVPLGDYKSGSQEELTVAISPLPNYTITIVDENMKPLPAGVRGQVVISGAGVGRVYPNNHNLSTESPVLDQFTSPFLKSCGWPLSHLSGDLGEMDSNGQLHLYGRIQGSTQIKLGGIRMDLQDIENAVVSTLAPQVAEAIISHRKYTQFADGTGPSGQDHLVAFVILSKSKDNNPDIISQPRTDVKLDSLRITAELRERLPLPIYMRPSIVVELEAFPSTISGKVDRAAIDAIPVGPPSHTSGRGHAMSESLLNVIERELWLLWKEVLPTDIMSRASVSGTAVEDRAVDFFNIGGNSLSLLALQALIKSRFQKRIQITRFFGASSLGDMAALIEDCVEGEPISRAAKRSVDWDEETAVPTSLMEGRYQAGVSSLKLNCYPKHGGTVVVLSGASGFLGKEILRQLLSDQNVSHVHCIAVRRPLSELFKGIGDTSKVTAYQGDLCTPKLGMSDQEAAAAFSSAHAVIHCAANVSFLETYHSLRLPNVTGTMELVRLTLLYASEGFLPTIHYVSTASVVRLSGLDTYGPWSVRAHQPSKDGIDGYVASKWAAEVFLERASQQTGLPVVMHRPSSITGPEAPQNDLMQNLLQYAALTKTVPDLGAWKGSLDFVNVATVAGVLVGEVMKSVIGSGNRDKNKESTGKERKSDVRYVYETGDVVIGLNKLAESVRATLNEESASVRVLPLDEWVDVVEEAGMHPLLATYLRSIGDDARVFFPRLLKG